MSKGVKEIEWVGLAPIPREGEKVGSEGMLLQLHKPGTAYNMRNAVSASSDMSARNRQPKNDD